MLILIFSVMLGWLPVSGRGGPSHLLLPAITLGAALAAILTRMVRTSVIEELSSDYVRTARAKGLSESAVLFRHAFRNALIPILTILGLQFGTLLAGTIVTESIFSWPGIGRLAVQAIEARDYPLLQGCILLIAVSYVARESADRPGVRAGGPAGALRMTALWKAAARILCATAAPGRWGFALTLLLVIVALAAPWLAPYNPIAQNLPARLAAPSSAHWMGTDQLGRDILSRILFGTRVSMLVSISVVFGAGIIGLAIGSLAGYFGGWFDRFVNIVLINAFLSFPGILLAIAFAAFLGPGLGKVIFALVVTGWAGYARLARAQILQAKEMEYVLAARSLGASTRAF